MIKTHRLSTACNMPNLASVERLTRVYEDDGNYFVVLMVTYEIDGLRVAVEEVTFVPIEFLEWRCLTHRRPRLGTDSNSEFQQCLDSRWVFEEVLDDRTV